MDNSKDPETMRLLCGDLLYWRQKSQQASIAGYDLAAGQMLAVAKQLEMRIDRTQPAID